LKEFITEFQDIFVMNGDDCGPMDRDNNHIDTGDACLIWQPPCRLLLAKQDEVNEMLKDMKKQGVIQVSDSPWSLPVMLIWKKNGDLRFCMEYRKLNDVTKKDCFLLLRIDSTQEKQYCGIKGYKLIGRFWQIGPT
jgi:hypothetical protein